MACGMPSALRTPVRNSGSRATRDAAARAGAGGLTRLESRPPSPSAGSVAGDAVQMRSVNRLPSSLPEYLVDVASPGVDRLFF